MPLPSEIISEIFSSISRKELADLQLVSRSLDSLIAAKVYPLYIIESIQISWEDGTNEEEKRDGLLFSQSNRTNVIDLEAVINIAPIPSYLRFRHVCLLNAFSFTTHFIEQLARMQNAFDGAELTISLLSVSCKNEQDLRLNTLDTIEKVTPIFDKVRDIRLFWADHDYTVLPIGPLDDINILSTPLILNCQRLLLNIKFDDTNRLGLVNPNQLVDWLFLDVNINRDGRYLVLDINRGAENILMDLISKRVELMNDRHVISRNGYVPRNGCDSDPFDNDPTDLISKRAKSMIERNDDVVVEFLAGYPTRLFKYPRKFTNE